MTRILLLTAVLVAVLSVSAFAADTTATITVGKLVTVTSTASASYTVVLADLLAGSKSGVTAGTATAKANAPYTLTAKFGSSAGSQDHHLNGPGSNYIDYGIDFAGDSTYDFTGLETITSSGSATNGQAYNAVVKLGSVEHALDFVNTPEGSYTGVIQYTISAN